MKVSIEKSRALPKKKLFAIKKEIFQPTTSHMNATLISSNYYEIENTLLQAEYRKAQAVTILRRYSVH